MTTRDIFSKQKWSRPIPGAPGTDLQTRDLTQDDFARQYWPSAHAIYDRTVYPDIFREIDEPVYDENGNETGETQKKYYVERVPRYGFAFQQIIATKQLIHLTGNDIQFDLNTDTETDTMKDDIRIFRDGWNKKGMEHKFFLLAKSVKNTGDGAFVGYIRNGKFGAEVLSYLNGDTLYPHFDTSGRLSCFARRYAEYDSDGFRRERLEVWDRTYLWYFHATTEAETTRTYTIEGYTVDGYTLEVRSPHGFDRVPIVYYRDPKGPCWAASQEAIEEYEVAFSQMAQNNRAFGFPILVLQGDNVAADHDIDGSIKILSMGPDDKADYISAPQASEAYMKELNTLYKMIYEQSFAVIPPELKSGDLPAAALKILYSPAYEKAMEDARDFDPVVRGIAFIFAYGYGVELEKSLDFVNLPIVPWIEPYVHQNYTAIVSDLAIGVQNKFISRQTASEVVSFYATANESERLKQEEEQEVALQAYEASRYTEPAEGE